MSWKSMLLTRCLLPFFTLTLLQHAFAYVAQSPDTISQSTPSLSLVTSDSPIAASLNGTYLPQEEPPLAFKVGYNYKQSGRAFGRLAFGNTMIKDMAAMADHPWNQDLSKSAVKFDSDYDISIAFIADRSGPGLKVKHVVWALEEIFDILVEHGRYEVGTFFINNNWDEGRIGLGSVTSRGIADSVAVSATDVRSSRLAGSMLESSSVNVTMIGGNDTAPILYPKLLETSALTQAADPYLPALNAFGVGDWIKLSYRPNGAIIHDVQIYNASLKLLIICAEVTNQKKTIWPMISTYNDMDDFTMTIRPVGFAKRSQLSWADAALALAYFAYYMSKQGGPQGRWAEVQGVVTNLQKLSVGVVCVEKGEMKEEACGSGDWRHGAVAST